jgi:diguanylate cyclase (GGDEF)-like protein
VIGLGVTIVISLLIILIFIAYNKRLEHIASIDDLTKLYNRRHFMQLMNRDIIIAQRYEQNLSLLMLDVDNFKSINDKFGHLIGDDMLRLIADTLKTCVRDTDLIGRWGGEEFVVLLLNTDTKTAVQTAQRIIKAVAESKLHINKKEIGTTISIGVSSLDATTTDDESLIQKTDEALFRAKANGKNTVSL